MPRRGTENRAKRLNLEEQIGSGFASINPEDEHEGRRVIMLQTVISLASSLY
jgi:hypothetical protein